MMAMVLKCFEIHMHVHIEFLIKSSIFFHCHGIQSKHPHLLVTVPDQHPAPKHQDLPSAHASSQRGPLGCPSGRAVWVKAGQLWIYFHVFTNAFQKVHANIICIYYIYIYAIDRCQYRFWFP